MMEDIGYYLYDTDPMSVREHKGQWCLFCRKENDRKATTDEQINACLMWRRINYEKFHSITT